MPETADQIADRAIAAHQAGGASPSSLAPTADAMAIADRAIAAHRGGAKPAAPKPPPVQTPKHADGTEKRPNPLRTASEYLTLPVSLGAAAADDFVHPGGGNVTPGSGYVPDKNALSRAIDMLRTKGPQAVNEEFEPWSDASTLRHHPGRPLPPAALTNFGEFMTQWENPANKLLGGAMGLGGMLAGKGITAARAASPVLNDSVSALEGAAGDVARPFQRASAAVKKPVKAAASAAGRAVVGAADKIPGVKAASAGIREAVSRYAQLRDRGGTPFVAAGVAAQSAPEHAVAQVAQATNERFGDLTRAQKLEVQKLAYRDDDGATLHTRDAGVPDPKKGASLADRAEGVRKDFITDDVEQESLGIRSSDKGELFNRNTFFPMRKFGDRAVWSDAEAEKAAELGDHVAAVDAVRRGRGGRTFGSAGVTKVGSKLHDTILEDGVEESLHPDYDPAHQYQEHRTETRKAIANERARLDLETLVSTDPKTGVPRTWTSPGVAQESTLTARVPLRYVLPAKGERPDIPLGEGEEGQKQLDRYIRATTRLRASEAARRDPHVIDVASTYGIAPAQLGTRTVVARNLAPIKGRVAEAADASGRLTRGLTRATSASAKAAALRAGDLRKMAQGLTSAHRSLLLGDDALGQALRENDALRQSLTSDVAEQKAAGRAALDELNHVDGVVRNQFNATGNREFDDYLFDSAKERGSNPAYMERRTNLEDANGNVTGSVRTSGNANRAKGMGDSLFTPGDITHARKTAADQGIKLSVKETDDLLHRAHGFMVDRETLLREIVDQYGSGPDAVKQLTRALRSHLDDLTKAQGTVAGADAASGPLTAAARKMRESTDLAGGKIAAAATDLTKPAADINPALDRLEIVDRGQRVRLKELRDQAKVLEGKSVAATAFRTAQQRYYGELYNAVKTDVEKRAVKMPEGYARERDLGLASPSGKDMALDDSFANFYEATKDLKSSDSRLAQVFWNSMNVLNRLSRASIVLLPEVHGINNLGMHYLAEGGDVGKAVQILAGKAKFAPDLEERALKAGAVNEYAASLFGGTDAHAATTASHELAGEMASKAGPLAGAVKPVIEGGLNTYRNVYMPMNQWLFGNVEHGYALDLFERFTKAGLSDGAAAIRVRNALGKYGDVTQRDRTLSRLFYFYPWMKTVIPFWAKKGVLDPKWWEAPVETIKRSNESQGMDDPARPFTATAGHMPDGSFRRIVVPVPQRVTEMLADTARIPFDRTGNDLGEDIGAPARYIAGHASLPLSIALNAAELGRGSLPPGNVFKVPDGQNPILAVGQNVLQRAIAPLETGARFASDPIGTLGSVAAGAFSYGVPTARQAKIKAMVDAEYSPLIGIARKAGRMDAVAKLMAQREAAVKQLTAAK